LLIEKMMELRHLRYFIAVAEELSLARAAERLHTVQPSLGRQIRQLEEIMGAPLLHRYGHSHSLELTGAGQLVLQESRKILQQIESLLEQVQQVAHSDAGRLTVGFFLGAEWRVFPLLLPYLRLKHPSVNLVLRSLIAPDVVTALENHTIDLGFLRSPYSDSHITSEVVGHDRIVAAIPARHPLAKLKRIPLQKLLELPLVVIKRAVAPELYDIADSLADQAGLRFSSKVETENILATLSAVGAGAGFSLIPSYLRQLLRREVAARPLASISPAILDLVVAYRKSDKRPILELFLTLVRDCFEEEQEE
jgi:LysR family hca operon transcriptional activator